MAKQRAIVTLRDFHRLGKEILQSDRRSPRRGREIRAWGSLENVRKKTRRGLSELAEARRFARLYNADKLRWICSLGRNAGKPLTKSHMIRLLRVADGRKRKGLAMRCAREAWSVQQLTHEIWKICPRRNYGGRKVSPPQSLDEALMVAEHLRESLVTVDRSPQPIY